MACNEMFVAIAEDDVILVLQQVGIFEEWKLVFRHALREPIPLDSRLDEQDEAYVADLQESGP